jgi:hypothetical protein
VRKFIDTDHPMLRPLWVRILLVAICAGWAVFEFSGGSAAWGVAFLALGGYAGWAFFLAPSDKPADKP